MSDIPSGSDDGSVTCSKDLQDGSQSGYEPDTPSGPNDSPVTCSKGLQNGSQIGDDPNTHFVPPLDGGGEYGPIFTADSFDILVCCALQGYFPEHTVDILQLYSPALKDLTVNEAKAYFRQVQVNPCSRFMMLKACQPDSDRFTTVRQIMEAAHRFPIDPAFMSADTAWGINRDSTGKVI